MKLNSVQLFWLSLFVWYWQINTRKCSWILKNINIRNAHMWYSFSCVCRPRTTGDWLRAFLRNWVRFRHQSAYLLMSSPNDVILRCDCASVLWLIVNCLCGPSSLQLFDHSCQRRNQKFISGGEGVRVFPVPFLSFLFPSPLSFSYLYPLPRSGPSNLKGFGEALYQWGERH